LNTASDINRPTWENILVNRRAGILAALVILVSSGCADSPVAPSSIPFSQTPAPLAGSWAGLLRITDCVHAGGCTPGATYGFVLRVASAGTGYVGAIEIADVSYAGINVDLTGMPQADGSVAFTGSRAPSDHPFDDGRVAVDVTRFVVKVDSLTGLVGSIEYTKGYFEPYSFAARILSAGVQPLTTTVSRPFEGRWSGMAVIRSCSGYCPLYRDPGDAFALQLVLGQAGDAVNGRGQFSVASCGGCWLTIGGAVVSSKVSLSSVRSDAPPGVNDRTMQLESFSGSRDDLGRIHGRFVYSADSYVYVPPFDISYRLECEILWLTRES
jgi:hypothetical protein